ncbi:MAG: hypothetical protein ACTHPD_15130 [Rhizomicrobium sp.]
MRGIAMGISLAFLSATAAFAADDVMAGFYGNTVISKGGMAEAHSYYNADHTFTMKAPSFNMEWKGTWKTEGGQLCRTYDKPPPGVSNPFCTPVEAHKVGDTWTVSGRTVTLVQGIQ